MQNPAICLRRLDNIFSTKSRSMRCAWVGHATNKDLETIGVRSLEVSKHPLTKDMTHSVNVQIQN